MCVILSFLKRTYVSRNALNLNLLNYNMKILQVAFLLLFNYLDSLPKLYYFCIYAIHIIPLAYKWSDHLHNTAMCNIRKGDHILYIIYHIFVFLNPLFVRSYFWGTKVHLVDKKEFHVCWQWSAKNQGLNFQFW